MSALAAFTFPVSVPVLLIHELKITDKCPFYDKLPPPKPEPTVKYYLEFRTMGRYNSRKGYDKYTTSEFEDRYYGKMTQEERDEYHDWIAQLNDKGPTHQDDTDDIQVAVKKDFF